MIAEMRKQEEERKKRRRRLRGLREEQR